MTALTKSGYLLSEEEPADAAKAILSSLEYLAREAQAASLPTLSRALISVILTSENWVEAETSAKCRQPAQN